MAIKESCLTGSGGAPDNGDFDGDEDDGLSGVLGRGVDARDASGVGAEGVAGVDTGCCTDGLAGPGETPPFICFSSSVFSSSDIIVDAIEVISFMSERSPICKINFRISISYRANEA